MKWIHMNGGSPTEEIFERVFWAFKASIDGFKYCRPVISIDDTFLYGKYKGKLLIAMGTDANNQIFPLAFAIVDEESFGTWRWFLNLLRRYVVPDREGICVISDRHNGIIAAINDAYCGFREPRGYHRFCLWHVESNFNSKFKNAYLKKLVMLIGSAHQVHKFNEFMEEIKSINTRA